ncbi:hypothetical protein DMENIID0001_075430 [Sergentomyia squamirostris]
MSDRVGKTQMIAELSAAGVLVPPTASIAQIRTLYSSINEQRINEDGVNIHVVNGGEHQSASDGSGVASNNEPPATEEEIDAAIHLMEKKRQLLQLQREVADLECAPVSTRGSQYSRIDFLEVEGAVQPFSGSDSYGIRKWLIDFENVAVTVYGSDDRFRLICARRLMTGTAKVFLRTLNVQSWDELRSALLQEFGRRKEVFEVYDELKKRLKLPTETYHQYILAMQELALNSFGSRVPPATHLKNTQFVFGTSFYGLSK